MTGHPLEWFRSYLSDQVAPIAQSRETPPVSLKSGVPQGSSLGPAQFNSYIRGMFCRHLLNIMHGVQYHLFGDDTEDDTQSYDHCAVTIACIQSTLTRLSSCINDLAAFFSSLRLQLNPMKSEFIWFGSRASLAKIPSDLRSLVDLRNGQRQR